MRFAKWIFGLSGIYGILILTPAVFLEHQVTKFAGPMRYPVYYFGFFGVALAWQAMFLLISSDPIRYRRAMLVGVLDKFGFALPAAILLVQGRLDPSLAPFAAVDLLLGVLFVAAFLATRHAGVAGGGG